MLLLVRNCAHTILGMKRSCKRVLVEVLWECPTIAAFYIAPRQLACAFVKRRSRVLVSWAAFRLTPRFQLINPDTYSNLSVMRKIKNANLWIGHTGDLKDPALFESEGIEALVHIALEELLPQLSRELLYCQFPLVDGAGNSKQLIAIAIDTTVALLQACIPTLVCCSAGMSRSPCIAAGALAIINNCEPSKSLAIVASDQPHDISPALWEAITKAVLARQ